VCTVGCPGGGRTEDTGVVVTGKGVTVPLGITRGEIPLTVVAACTGATACTGPHGSLKVMTMPPSLKRKQRSPAALGVEPAARNVVPASINPRVNVFIASLLSRFRPGHH
jgi:hypothetical protein